MYEKTVRRSEAQSNVLSLDSLHTFTYSQLRNKHIRNSHVNLPGIGDVEAIFHRPIPTGFIVKLGTVKLEADGWYISLSLEDKSIPQVDEEICPTMENSIAIDVGLERFLTCDNGSYVEIPRFLRKSADRMSRLQHRKSKLSDGDKDKRKLHKAIFWCSQKIVRQRLNFHFNTAYKLFEKADVVFVEDLQLKNLIRRNKPKSKDGKFVSNGQSSSSGMNKSWSDAAHGKFIQVLEWVAWKLGKSVVKVDPWGTSQFCHACLNKVPKSLNDRWHSCYCGASLNRDENSGKLIELVGLGLASLKTALLGKSSKTEQLSVATC